MRTVLATLAIGLAACGGLESPDLSTGAIAGRVAPVSPGGRAYVLGLPGVRAELDAEGAFFLQPVPVGAAAVVVFDGDARAGLLTAVVHGAEVTWVGPAPAPASDSAPQAPGSANSALPLAATILARASATGTPVPGVRFTVEGTDLAGVAPDPTGDAVLAPLPPGTFELVARADGFAEARKLVEVRSGESVTVDVTFGLAAP
jgi:hypothetical protein